MKRLNFEKTKKLLAQYDLPYVQSVFSESGGGVLRAARKMGWPVVLKTACPSVVHRTEQGGVVIGINSKKELEEAWKQVSKLGKEVIVQSQVGGTEVIMGMKKDDQFGPVLMFGLGGIFVEVLKDLCFRVAPIDKKEAREMLEEIKGFKLLKGVRGRTGVDLNRLADVLTKLSKLAVKEKDIEEIDFNPVIANSKGALIVDAKIIKK